MAVSRGMRAGPFQPLDTVHGLDGDGPEPVPRVNGIRGACPRPNVELSGRLFLPPRCGLRAAHPHGDQNMRFYNQPHAAYCGVDRHARTMYLHILDDRGRTRLDQNLPARPDAFLAAVAPFRGGLVVGCECMFAWYWLADLCEDQGIPFVLGHALYLKMIHGGKAK